MLAALLKRVVESPAVSVGTAIGISTIIILTVIHLSYEIRIKKIQLENLKKNE